MKRDVAMKEIINVLLNEGVYLSDCVTLDFFAREGDWQTKELSKYVNELHAWEIETRFETNLKKNLPGSKIVIGDSFKTALDHTRKFDLIVLDNPQSTFGNYCEHFEALDLIPLLLKDHGGIVIFNVKTRPFNYDSQHLWQERRNKFYGIDDASCLTESFVFSFYEKFFESKGFNVDLTFWVKRPQEEDLYAFVANLSR